MAQVKPGTPAKIIVNNATIGGAETPPSTQSAQTAVVAVSTWGIGFPLTGYTAFTAPVSTVMDNAVLERPNIAKRKFYVFGNVIKAFNDEIGDKQYGDASRSLQDILAGLPKQDPLRLLPALPGGQASD